MDETYINGGRSRRNATTKTYHHHYRVEGFVYVINEQVGKLDDKQKLLRLSQIFRINLAFVDQLGPYIRSVIFFSIA